MSKIDVKNYLKAIYQVPVVQVHTRIQLGKYRQIIDNGWRKRKKFPDYKVAYVYLGEGQKFKFPDLFLPLEEELPKKEDESEVETTAKEKKISKVKEEDSPEEETEEEEEESKRWF